MVAPRAEGETKRCWDSVVAPRTKKVQSGGAERGLELNGRT